MTSKSKQILLKLGWKTLDERRQNLMEKCMSDVMNDNGPEILSSLFEKSATISIIIQEVMANSKTVKTKYELYEEKF